METESVRVARGAALLDETVPGWHRHIDLEYLDLNSPHLCVLGQIFTPPLFQGVDVGASIRTVGYPIGVFVLRGINETSDTRWDEFTFSHGFEGDGDATLDIVDQRETLRAEWEALIKARR